MLETIEYNQNINKFEKLNFNSIKTQGIKYTGSKDRLLPFILKKIYSLHPKIVMDGFSGTTRVSQALAKTGYSVISNDLSVWSKTFATCYLLNKRPKEYYKEITDYLNNLPGKYGWFSENYGGKANEKGVKRPFQIHNTMKLDAIREEIDKIASNEVEKATLLTSLILALDKVDSTIGHYSAYLKNWSPRSYNTMKLEVPSFILSDTEHQVYQEDIFKLLPNLSADVAYFDPPYGSSNNKMPASRVRYQAYYHIWTTIILNDHPKLFGRNNRRQDSSDTVSYSPFEDFRKNENGKYIACEAIEKLIKNTNAQYIIFSYSSGGRVSFQDLLEIFSSYTKILEVQKIDYRKNVMSNMKWTYEWIEENNRHQEYIFTLKKI